MDRQVYIDKVVDEIMTNFDFPKVHKVMKKLKWKWASSQTEDKIPSQYELHKKAEQLIRDAMERKVSFITGGFVVRYRQGVDPTTGFFEDVTLSFEVTSWSSENV
jgi:hypothetical protein